MKAFADLLERLLFTPGRNAKLAHLGAYFSAVPDPDRGWALAALAGTLEMRTVTPSRIRGLVEERVDPELFRLSYDFVGDLAETVALIWPGETGGTPPELTEVVEQLRSAGPVEAMSDIARFCARLDGSGRLALIKLATGGMRVGVSARMVLTALAQASGRDLSRIEEFFSALEPPYVPLFAWLEGGPEPQIDLSLAFRPMMLAHPLEADRLSDMDPNDWRAEWKWDGIRVQAISFREERRLYSRTGEDIAGAFPDVIDSMRWQGAVDGELLIVRDGDVAPFADLQKRLGRKRVSAKILTESPAHLRLYDMLHDGETDLRALPLDARRSVLQTWHLRHAPARTDLSEPIPFDAWEDLATLRDTARLVGQEGLMLKRGDAPYEGGRRKGLWFKWKRDPLEADCVLIYAQRGHGKRSSYYSDYTFAAWRDGAEGPELVPVGKAYSGFTDEELLKLDRFVRNNTLDRHGPVRVVRPALVLEVAFDAVQLSTRHKSGIAMRFPRIKRIRWDKPAAEADWLGTLRGMIDPPCHTEAEPP